jgi:hypothetical protein
MTQAELEALFTARGIDFRAPGFYDSPAFLAVERSDNRFLERYAEYVDRQQYTPEYLERARSIVPRVASFVYRHLIEDGRLGACIDVSAMVSRMLDLEGIWSYTVGGGVSVNYPASSRIPSAHFGVLGGQSRVAAHMWIRVPPFAVLDITLPAQPRRPECQPFYPSFVMEEESRPSPATVLQMFDMDELERVTLMLGRRPTMRDVFVNFLPRIRNFMECFPPFAVNYGELVVEYAPTKINASDRPLSGMRHPILTGHSPSALYELFKNGDSGFGRDQ